MVKILYHRAGAFQIPNLSNGISPLNVSVELSALYEPLTAIPEDKRTVGVIADIPQFIDTDARILCCFG